MNILVSETTRVPSILNCKMLAESSSAVSSCKNYVFPMITSKSSNVTTCSEISNSDELQLPELLLTVKKRVSFFKITSNGRSESLSR
jgi:hypothetical protein